MATADLTWSDVRAGIRKLCQMRGWHHGVPIMSSTDPTRRIVLAKGCPLSNKHGHDKPVAIGPEPPEWFRRRRDGDLDDGDDTKLVNTWITSSQTFVMRSKGLAQVARLNPNTERMRVLLDSMLCQSGTVDAETEIIAMGALFRRINENQRDSYILSGCFPETSRRSGVSYILRKGRPTLAIKCEPQPQGGEKRVFLAALCTHPLAWFEGTFAGAYPPSDEVLANLLQIRADEHGFWKKSNQHGIDDPLSGI